MAPFEKQYARKEAAGILGVSYDTVGRLIRNGELEAVALPRCGGRGLNIKYLISESAILQFLKWNRKERRHSVPPLLINPISPQRRTGVYV